MLKVIAIALLLTLPVSGNAQIYRCTSETGTIIFSEVPCADDAEVVPSHRLNVNVHDRSVSTPSTYAPPRQVPEARQMATPSPPPATATRKPEPYEINTRYDNLIREVRGLHNSRDTFAKSRLSNLLQNIERQRSRALAAQSVSSDWSAINARFDGMVREARSSLPLGSKNQDFDKMRLAGQLVKIEASRDAALYAVAPPTSNRPSTSSSDGGMNLPAPPSPSVITNCDSAGCWDNLGNRYNRGAGNTFFGPTGACQQVGNMMQCP